MEPNERLNPGESEELSFGVGGNEVPVVHPPGPPVSVQDAPLTALGDDVLPQPPRARPDRQDGAPRSRGPHEEEVHDEGEQA